MSTTIRTPRRRPLVSLATAGVLALALALVPVSAANAANAGLPGDGVSTRGVDESVTTLHVGAAYNHPTKKHRLSIVVHSPERDATPQCIACGAPVRKIVKVSGPVLQSKKFVRYLTGSWAKSTGYTWSASTTVGATISAGRGVSARGASSNLGVSASITRTYSVATNIRASSSKFSKLGLASDYKRYYVKSAYHQNGKPVSGAKWTYGYLSSPTKDQYLIAYYK